MAVGLARKGADDFSHATGPEQSRQPDVAVAGVVVDHRHVFCALRNQSVNQFIGNAGVPKPPTITVEPSLTPANATSMDAAILLIICSGS